MEFKRSQQRKTYQRSSKNCEINISNFAEVPVEYESVCRLCLEKHEYMSDIFKDDNLVPIIVKIQTLLGLRIREEQDDLPILICDRCTVVLNEFYNYKKRCIANDVKLRQMRLKRPLPKWKEIGGSLGNLTLPDEKCDPNELKKDCTIMWDDQVPLAGIISTNMDLINSKTDNHVNSKPIFFTTITDINVNTVIHSTKCDETSNNENKVKDKLSPKEDDFDLMPLAERLSLKEQEDPDVLKYKCDYCDRSFKCNSLWRRHLRMHTGERPFLCQACGRTFAQKDGLQRHSLQIHSKTRPYRCHYCNKRFSVMCLLKAHIKATHIKKEKYQCPSCPKVFIHASGLSRHKNVHDKVVYQCNVCYKSFTDSSSVNRHVKLKHSYQREEHSKI